MADKFYFGMKNNIVQKVSKEICTGCGACMAKCPQRCITMKAFGDAGFYFPVIDNDSCINCGICVKTCPLLHDLPMQKVDKVYAAYIKERNMLQNSNSGGIFTAFADYILRRNGFVCGAAYSENLYVKHIIISNLEEISLLQGSKYVQSIVCQHFNKVLHLLNNGKLVLFCGTGCQIAGLRSFLKNEYENLLTIELVCHGVPSPVLFEKYLLWLGKRAGGKVTQYKFRSKELRPTGEHSQFYYIVDGEKFIGESYEDPYYGSFLQGRTLRPSCYQCRFKGQERIGDITIGDFWGIEKSHPDFSIKHGSCLVMVNTEKGIQYFSEIKEQLRFIEATYEEAINRNPSVYKSCDSPQRPVNYNAPNLFDKELKPKLSLKDKLKNRLPWQVKWFLKKYF